MATKENPGAFDCYANALPDEPMFILLARDPSAPLLVERWAIDRDAAILRGERPAGDMAAVREAGACAAAMREWRARNAEAAPWRRPPALSDALPTDRGDLRARLQLLESKARVTSAVVRGLLPLAEAYMKGAPSHPDNAILEDARAALRESGGAAP